jgi:hypothetical protein
MSGFEGMPSQSAEKSPDAPQEDLEKRDSPEAGLQLPEPGEPVFVIKIENGRGVWTEPTALTKKLEIGGTLNFGGTEIIGEITQIKPYEAPPGLDPVTAWDVTVKPYMGPERTYRIMREK